MMIRCPSALVAQTLDILRTAGRRGTEGIVLWLSKRPLIVGSSVVEAHVPIHTAKMDVFRIPPDGMTALMSHLRAKKLAIAAQVHSHPAAAFHSRADDEWAIVRHEGALSMVVPNFAKTTIVENFAEHSATFRLSADDRWEKVPGLTLSKHLIIEP